MVINDPNDFIKILMNKKKKDDINISMNLNFDINALNVQIKKNNIKAENIDILINKFNFIKKNTKPNTFCLKCNICNETFILSPCILKTIKLKKISNINTNSLINIKELITDMTLFRTKDFICPNKECNPPIEQKEAIIYRINPNEFITQYICTNCETIF
jgi:hypothetical protein